MVCAAGHANLQALIEDGMIENSKQLGKKFHQKLDEIKNQYSKYISSVQGIGLLAAVIFKDDNDQPLSSLCDLISEKCLQTGLLVVHTGRESIKLAPPLMINEEALLEGLDVFSNAIEDSVKEIYGN
jgi:4-aminobutyrate aminotransferase-like enzyme